MKNNDYGRSMIEMLGVLAIVGALSTGGIVGYTKMLNQSKINTSIEQISVVSGQLSTIGANGGNYSGLNNRAAIKLKAVLQDMVSGSNLKNPFGGNITIASSSMSSNDDLAYTIRYDGLNHQACMAMATHDWGSVKNSSFIAVIVGANVHNNTVNAATLGCSGSLYNLSEAVGCNGGSTLGVPMPATEAGQACSGCRSSGFCSIVLKYY